MKITIPNNYIRCEQCHEHHGVSNYYKLGDECKICAEGFDENILTVTMRPDFKLTEENIYKRTQKSWCVSAIKAKTIKFVLSVVNGVVVGVWQPEAWNYAGGNRKDFMGIKANDTMHNRFINKDISNIRRGRQPVQYFRAEQIIGCPLAVA